jgi:hypothetical protein
MFLCILAMDKDLEFHLKKIYFHNKPYQPSDSGNSPPEIDLVSSPILSRNILFASGLVKPNSFVNFSRLI